MTRIIRLVYIELMLKKYSKGFTLIELLVVIGILGILLAIVLIAINPARQFAQANNTKRSSDVTTILNAIHQYSADHHGQLPTNMPAKPGSGAGTPVEIKSGGNGNIGDICADLVPTYVSLMPQDPKVNNGAGLSETQCAAGYTTGYQVAVDSSGRVTVDATLNQESIAGQTVNISVTR